MSAVAGAGTVVGTALADTMVEESRSALATAIAHIINFIRTLAVYAMEYMRRFLAWCGEHPLAAVLLVANIITWVS